MRDFDGEDNRSRPLYPGQCRQSMFFLELSAVVNIS